MDILHNEMIFTDDVAYFEDLTKKIKQYKGLDSLYGVLNSMGKVDIWTIHPSHWLLICVTL